MNCEISESLKALAAEYDRATTQKERDRLMREIARVSDKQERDRDGAHRRDTRQGVFEASMLSLDEHMAKFDDPGKIATFSDGGRDAEAVRSCGEDLRSGVVDPAVKKRLLNRLRKHPQLQKALRRLIANATGGKRKPVKKTHIEKIFEILFEPIKKGV